MEFYRPKKKAANVPIVPLIDILTILLIVFIIKQGDPKKEDFKYESPPTSAPKPRPILQLNLPTVREVPSTTIVDQRATLAVTPNGRITLDGFEVPSANLLTDALVVFKDKNPGKKLELAADEGVTLSQLFMIWDALTAAEFEIKEVPARISLPKEVDFVDPLQR